MFSRQQFSASLSKGADVVSRELRSSQSTFPTVELQESALACSETLERFRSPHSILHPDGRGVPEELLGAFFEAVELLPMIGHERLATLTFKSAMVGLEMSMALSLGALSAAGDEDAFLLFSQHQMSTPPQSMRQYLLDVANCLERAGDAHTRAIGGLVRAHLVPPS